MNSAMTDDQFDGFIETIKDTFVAKSDSLNEIHRKRFRFMLGDLDGKPVSYEEAIRALRVLAGEGQVYEPKPGEVLARVRAERSKVVELRPAAELGGHDRRTFQAMWRYTLGMYGHAMTVRLMDPFGRFMEWRPSGSEAVVDGRFSRARAHLVELGVMEPVEEPNGGPS